MLLINTGVILATLIREKNQKKTGGFTQAFIKFLINLVPTTVLLFTLQVGDYIELFNRHTSAYSIFQNSKQVTVHVENHLSNSQLYDLYGAESFVEGDDNWLVYSTAKHNHTGSF